MTTPEWSEVRIEDAIAEYEAATVLEDEHGVPSNMFGPVPEEFYGLVGRVAMIWPVVEKELHWLHDTITGAAQDVAAGMSFGRLIERCEKAIRDQEGELRDLVDPVLQQVRDVARRRNEIVHSMFPDPTLQKAKGHRPVRPTLRQPGSPDWTVWIYTSGDKLRSLIAAEVAAMDSIIRVRLTIDRLSRSGPDPIQAFPDELPSPT